MSFGILMPEIEHGKSTDQNVADVPSGDLISRADAIGVLRGLFDMRKSRAKVIVECFGELLNALPSADRPKGEWNWTHGGQCSECGFHNTNFDFNFCPNCGADMRPDK